VGGSDEEDEEEGDGEGEAADADGLEAEGGEAEHAQFLVFSTAYGSDDEDA
jgi:hypothetical protein